MSVAAAVLAAGRGVRFGGEQPKALLQLRGRALIAYALEAALASGCAPVVAVVSDESVADAATDAVVLRNADPARGIASSLHCALTYLEPEASVTAVVVGLADQPAVGAEAYRRVAASEAPLAVATYGGRRANPVRIDRAMWPAAMQLAGDTGARALFERFGVVEVPCDGTGDPADVDTPADLAALESRWRSPTASE
ncbi:MAG TPA: nucleotidyltransferase family protein [Acidimicrobiia bacterium]|nr:nucleotidyltransferase family protein [Acidimicrobiia bacterium]